MQPQTYVVDGYNVIRSLVAPADLARGLETARAILEAKLRRFRDASPGVRIILVYDGSRGAPSMPRREPRFEIRFARPPARADDLVVETARALDGGPGVHVVSSDLGDVVERVAGFRVVPLAAREFADRVERRLARRGEAAARAESSGDASKPDRVAPAEVEDWVRRFGFGEEKGPS